MPYDTNGNYTLPIIYYAISGTVINPSQHNTPLEDVQAALNRALLRDGTAPMTGNLNANGNKITGLTNGTNSGDAVAYGQISGFLSNTALTGKTTAENLYVSTDMTVPNVSDWTSDSPVTAWQADGRYVANYAAISGGTGIKGAVIDSETHEPAFLDTNGNWHPVQPYGKYQPAGDYQPAGNYQPAGDYQPAGNYQPAGDYATTADLGNYVPSSTYVADFSTSDTRVTNLPYNQREVGFNVLITSNGQYVPFPEAFADVPVSVVCGDCGNDAGKTDAWPICAPMQKWTAAGCNVYIGSAAVPRRVSIIAKGSR